VVQRLRHCADRRRRALSRRQPARRGRRRRLDLNNLAIYRLTANTPPESPQRVCTYHSKDGSTAYADPTFSPRGDALAFAQDAPGKSADGIYVWSLRKGCTGKAKRVARGARDPDFGPAGF
jgi:hypothetical protein